MLYDKFQVEINNYCNANCPGCIPKTMIPRSEQNKSITLDEFKDFFHWKEVSFIMLTGNAGEPTLHPDFMEIVRFIKQDLHARVKFSTNASTHDPAWWAELASLLTDRDIIIFAIDGLEDTLPIYRVGCDFNNVIKNCKALIDNCDAQTNWYYIQFEHNIHQIDQAEALSTQLGFKRFVRRYSWDFNHPSIKPIRDRDISNIRNFQNVDTIRCKLIPFISVDKLLFPCCSFAHSYLYEGKKHYEELRAIYDESINSLNNFSINEILSNPFYKNLYRIVKTLNLCRGECNIITKIMERVTKVY